MMVSPWRKKSASIFWLMLMIGCVVVGPVIILKLKEVYDLYQKHRRMEEYSKTLNDVKDIALKLERRIERTGELLKSANNDFNILLKRREERYR